MTSIEDSQPEINVGLVGHVDHGKTSLTFALSGKWTDEHSEELKRGITIRLGYADVIIYKGDAGYGTDPKDKNAVALRKISLVDAPGHETLMATMLSGAAIMDGALLLVAANEQCPQPQTKEHLMALQIIGVKNIVIVQNKIDLVTEEQALANYKQIKDFVKGTIAENAPIIPISAQHKININHLIEAIEETIPTPERDKTKEAVMYIARSFDVNRPGTDVKKLVGGVLGGALKQGVLKVGDKIEIKPGMAVEEKEGRKIYKPIITEVAGLKTGGRDVKEVGPGGSVGVLTKLDPFYVKSDSLTGNMIGRTGTLPEVWHEFAVKPTLLERVVGTKEDLVVEPVKKNEVLMLNVHSAATVGIVSELRKKGEIFLKLKIPVCANKGDRLTISRVLGNRWRLIGMGEISG